MRRQTSALFAAIVAGALVLSGCGSDDPATDTSSSAGGASSSADAPAPSSDAGSSDAAGSDSAGSDAAGSDAAGSDSAGSEPAPESAGSDEMSSEASSAGMGSESSDSGAAGAEESSAAGGSATSGGSAGTGESSVAPADFDEQTIGWFSGMCDGFGSLVDMDRPQVDAGGDFEAQKAAAVEYYNKTGAAATGTADKLDALPPPNLEGGAEFATGFSAALRAAGEEAAKQAPIVEQTTDAASLEKAIDTAEDALDKSLGAVGPEVQAVITAPGVREAMLELPACKPLVGN